MLSVGASEASMSKARVRGLKRKAESADKE